ncbi:MAG TPA: LamG domain-containing protein, partial [Candidatus Nanoarchaeia archaeon]|nr:LamG domain-containing protein [Candidatus Nanoarchaeia archaeon]
MESKQAIGLVLLLMLLFSAGTAIAARVGLLTYAEDTQQAPRYRLWTGTGWSGEFNATQVGGAIHWIELASSPTRSEYILATADNQYDINIQVNGTLSNGTGCWHNGTDCNSTIEVTTGTTVQNGTKVGVAYEQLSGDALIVWSNTSANQSVPTVMTWNATARTWSTQYYINSSSISDIGPLTINAEEVYNVKLVSKPRSDEIAVAYSTAARDLNIVIWNGTGFDCEPTAALELNLNNSINRVFDIAYEQVSGDLFGAWGFNVTADLFYVEKANGTCTFSKTIRTQFQEITNQVSVGAQNGTDYIIVSQSTGQATDDLNAGVWNGTVWEKLGPNDAAILAGDVQPMHLHSTGWAGSSEYGLVVYSDASNLIVDYLMFNKSASNGESWSGNASTGIHWTPHTPNLTTGESNIEVYTFLDANMLLSVHKDTNGRLFSKLFNNATNPWNWSNTEPNSASLEMTSNSSNPHQTFDFAFKAAYNTTSKPEVTLLTELPDSVDANSTIYVNATIIDEDDPISATSVRVQANWSNGTFTNYTATAVGANYYNASLPTNATGVVTLRWFANDSRDNINNTERSSFNVAMVQAPGIVNMSPPNETYFSEGNFNVTINFTYVGGSAGEVHLFLGNTTGSNSRDGLIYKATGLSNGNVTSYNFTSLPVFSNQSALGGLWHLDNRSGYTESSTLAFDFSESDNNGTMGGTPVWTQGRLGGAYYFDANDYIKAGNSSEMAVQKDPSNPLTGRNLTISAWVKRANTNSGVIVAIRRDPSGGFILGVGVNDCVGGNAIAMTKFNQVGICTGSFPADTEWHYLVGMWNDTGSYAYIDGALSGSSNDAIGILASGGNLTIGGDIDSDQGYSNGTIDDVAIWNKSMTSAQILQMYQADTDDYYWYANATDNTAATNKSEVRFLSSNPRNYAPNVTNILKTPNPANPNVTIELNATVVDTGAVASVMFMINWTNGTQANYTATAAAGNVWWNRSIVPSILGRQNFTAWANDTFNKINNSEVSFFEINDTPPNLTNPLETPDPVEAGNVIELNITCEDNTACSEAMFQVAFPNN